MHRGVVSYWLWIQTCTHSEPLAERINLYAVTLSCFPHMNAWHMYTESQLYSCHGAETLQMANTDCSSSCRMVWNVPHSQLTPSAPFLNHSIITFTCINWPWRTIMDVSLPWNSLETLLFALKGGASMPFMPSLTVNEVPETVVNALGYTEQVKERWQPSKPVLRNDVSHLWAVVLMTN